MSNPHATYQLVRSHLSFLRLQHRSAVLSSTASPTACAPTNDTPTTCATQQAHQA